MPYKNKEDQKQWREANKDKIDQINKRWRENHPDKIRENNEKRVRVSEKSTKEHIPYKWCIRCHARIPLSNTSTVVCESCNTRMLFVPCDASRYTHGVRLRVIA